MFCSRLDWPSIPLIRDSPACHLSDWLDDGDDDGADACYRSVTLNVGDVKKSGEPDAGATSLARLP